MAQLRIGIDVGGTFTHGVLLRPPGEVLLTARTPTTHSSVNGVAAGVGEVLRLLLSGLEPLGLSRGDVELVAHSTTQATNALLEGDVSAVHLFAIAPPGELPLLRRSLGERVLDIGGGHGIRVWPKLSHDWDKVSAERFPPSPPATPEASNEAEESLSTLPEPDWRRPGWDSHGIPAGFKVSARLPVAVIQPLAGKQENREQIAAEHYRACGHSVVCASEITEVLGLKARARTAIVNAAMLPKMLATADFTEDAVQAELPQAMLQVVRSDGGAMSIAEMRRQPVLSLLSGPAAGASAALDLSGLSEVVFIEVGGTSTDITLISEGRVRQKYATVGGQRLMVPALDLRTVAVGGGSMLRADKGLFGPRSAHVAGLPYLFQQFEKGLKFNAAELWRDPQGGTEYVAARMDDGSLAAFTMTDMRLALASSSSSGEMPGMEVAGQTISALKACSESLGSLVRSKISKDQRKARKSFQAVAAELDKQHPEQGFGKIAALEVSDQRQVLVSAFTSTCQIVAESVRELAASQRVNLKDYWLVGGGGGAPVILTTIAGFLGMVSMEGLKAKLIPHHSVISAIGAALAVSSVSISRSIAQPGAADIAALSLEVEERLQRQGSERVSTDFQYDAQRQVLTVTGRGSRPYEANARALSAEELLAEAARMLEGQVRTLWDSPSCALFAAEAPAGRRVTGQRCIALSRSGRSLWLGQALELIPAAAGAIEKSLAGIMDTKTQYTDGGPALPGLALLADGRFMPLDQLSSREMISEVLRWEKLPANSGGCFIIRQRAGA